MSRDEPARRPKRIVIFSAVAFIASLAGGGGLAHVAVPFLNCHLDKSPGRLVQANRLLVYRSGRSRYAEFALASPDSGTFSLKNDEPPDVLGVRLHDGALRARWVEVP